MRHPTDYVSSAPDPDYAEEGKASAFPAPKARMRRRIGLALYRQGAQARDALACRFIKRSWGSKFNTLRTIDGMLADGQLIERNGLLDIPERVRTDYALLASEDERKAGKRALAPPVAPRPFKPLSACFIPPLGGPRDCPVREFHPVSMSSRVRERFEFEE